MLALIVECLRLNFRKICGLMVFQLYHTYHLAIFLNSAISLLRIRLILLLCYEVEVWRRIQGIAKHLDKEFTKKTLLELFFFRLLDIQLYILIQEI